MPAAAILFGIIQVVLGMYGAARNHFFRRGFGFFIFGFISAFFCSLLLKSNNITADYTMSQELDLAFLISIYALAFVSAAGFLYLYYTNFLPQLFIRSALFFGLVAFTSIVVSTFKSTYKPSIQTQNPKHKFLEIEEKK